MTAGISSCGPFGIPAAKLKLSDNTTLPTEVQPFGLNPMNWRHRSFDGFEIHHQLTTGSTRHMDYILTVPGWIEFWPTSSGDPVAEVPNEPVRSQDKGCKRASYHSDANRWQQ
jgi:hypothetical protein